MKITVIDDLQTRLSDMPPHYIKMHPPIARLQVGEKGIELGVHVIPLRAFSLFLLPPPSSPTKPSIKPINSQDLVVNSLL